MSKGRITLCIVFATLRRWFCPLMLMCIHTEYQLFYSYLVYARSLIIVV